MAKGALLAVLMFVAGGGCLHPSDSPVEESQITWGLGLDTSSPPPPAPLIENRTELSHLFAFANSSIEPLLNRCGALTESRANQVRQLASQHEMRAFGALYNACDVHGTPQLRSQGDAAMANGTAPALYRRLYEQALNLTPRAWDSVRHWQKPGSAVDAEWLAKLQIDMVEADGTLDRAERYYKGFNETGEAGYLYGALDSLTWLINHFEVAIYYNENYDWMPGECDIPTLEEEWTRLMAWYDRVHAMAEKRSPEEQKDDGHGSMYGYLGATMLPNMKLLHDNGFVIGLFDWHADLQFHEAFWNNVNRTTYPTWEEALYLVHLHRSKLASISTTGIDTMEEIAVYNWERSWERAGIQSIRPIALQEVTWHYGELNCQSEDSDSP